MLTPFKEEAEQTHAEHHMLVLNQSGGVTDCALHVPYICAAAVLEAQ